MPTVLFENRLITPKINNIGASPLNRMKEIQSKEIIGQLTVRLKKIDSSPIGTRLTIRELPIFEQSEQRLDESYAQALF